MTIVSFPAALPRSRWARYHTYRVGPGESLEGLWLVSSRVVRKLLGMVVCRYKHLRITNEILGVGLARVCMRCQWLVSSPGFRVAAGPGVLPEHAPIDIPHLRPLRNHFGEVRAKTWARVVRWVCFCVLCL